MGQSAIVDLLLVQGLESSDDGRLAERMVHGPSASHRQVKIPAVGTTGCHSLPLLAAVTLLFTRCLRYARTIRIVWVWRHSGCHWFGTCVGKRAERTGWDTQLIIHE